MEQVRARKGPMSHHYSVPSIPTVKEEISRFSSLYAVRLHARTNELIATLTELPIHRRLRQYWPHDLFARF
jgi:hypothetical protein